MCTDNAHTRRLHVQRHALCRLWWQAHMTIYSCSARPMTVTDHVCSLDISLQKCSSLAFRALAAAMGSTKQQICGDTHSNLHLSEHLRSCIVSDTSTHHRSTCGCCCQLSHAACRLEVRIMAALASHTCHGCHSLRMQTVTNSDTQPAYSIVKLVSGYKQQCCCTDDDKLIWRCSHSCPLVGETKD